MSDEKALALLLADAIWPWPGISILTDGQARKLSQAAAELRRLHEAHDWQYKMAGDRLRRIEKLEAVNDELLEALQRIAGYDLPDEAAIVEVARAAIAKAEGK